MEKFMNLAKFKKSKKLVITRDYSQDNVNNEFVKALRNKLNMSQTVFAAMLGVTKKTIEKWEQGTNPVGGTSAKLLFLLSQKNELVSDLYMVEVQNNEIENTALDKAVVTFNKQIDAAIRSSMKSEFLKDIQSSIDETLNQWSSYKEIRNEYHETLSMNHSNTMRTGELPNHETNFDICSASA